MIIMENSYSNFTISEGQFQLRDIIYPVTSTSLWAYYQDQNIILFPSVDAKTTDPQVEYEMRCVSLYHNNGFNTHCSTFAALKGKKFVWTSDTNIDEEEAGYFCVQEHECVQNGTIEILDVTSTTMTIHWSGEADVFWSEPYGSNVPFETIFTVELPTKISYALEPFQSTKTIINENTELELLNIDQFNEEVNRISASREWDQFNTVLEFRLICEGTGYNGTVVFTNGKNNHVTTMEENCPKKVCLESVNYNLKCQYEIFLFVIE